MYLPVSRRRFLAQSGQFALGASAAGSILAACGGSQSSGGSGKPSGTVKMWIGQDDAKRRQYIKTHDIDAFNKTHPDITMDVSFKPIDGIYRFIQAALT